MSSRIVRSGLCAMRSPRRYESPAIPARGRPCATSCTVKSNSLRATKSSAALARREASGATATAAPTMPIMSWDSPP